ncbi:peroxidase family protein [Mesorhizobium sp. M0296]|uniref:peroxidase family protein n=1 Tax=Mesorhizobium sp. M0296 TaxID=2956931 RepID=UPI00333B13FA
MRDKSRDGLINRVEAYLLSRFSLFWRLVMAIPPLRRWANKRIIGRAAQRAPSRPHALSSMPCKGDPSAAMAGYTSWESLTDRNWFSRHLPPRTLKVYPDVKLVAELFKVRADGPVISEDSTVLFLSFAQWFTDGFLMTDTADRRRTHTSHHIDLNPLYGLTREQTHAVRMMSEIRGERGRLKFEEIGDEIYAPKLYDEKGVVKPEFAVLRAPLGIGDYLNRLPADRAAEIRKYVFAFAGDRANSTPFTTMLNTLFLREHNRLAKILETAYPAWDDERIFQTARNINIVELIKIVVEDYINHISPYHFQLLADPKVCWREYWNKPNWIPIEFNLLYRWHSLVPDSFMFEGERVAAKEVGFDNSFLMASGLASLAASASQQRAWEIGLFNTAPFLVPIELAAVEQSRTHLVGSYNDYREVYGYPRVNQYEQITGDQGKIDALRRLYGDDPDNVELVIGLFAEDVGPRAAVPPLIGRMVAFDAFSQALTNPLLAECVFNENTFTKEGLGVIAATARLQDVVNRNLAAGQESVVISMQITKLD